MSFKAKHSQEQYEVTMEMLAYHRQCTEIEITSIKEMEPLDESLQQQLLKYVNISLYGRCTCSDLKDGFLNFI